MAGRGLWRLVRAAGVTAFLILPVTSQQTAPQTQGTPSDAGSAAEPSPSTTKPDTATTGATTPTTPAPNAATPGATPAPNAGAPPTPAPPAANQLPPVDGIQKQAQTAPKRGAQE